MARKTKKEVMIEETKESVTLQNTTGDIIIFTRTPGLPSIFKDLQTFLNEEILNPKDGKIYKRQLEVSTRDRQVIFTYVLVPSHKLEVKDDIPVADAPVTE